MYRYLLVLMIAALLLVLPQPVQAQETPEPTVTPTVTPTPAYQQVIPLSSGNELLVVRRVTFGEIAVVVVVLVNIMITLLRAFVEIPKRWLQH